MSEATQTEDENTEAFDGSGDSAVIRALRAELKAAKSDLKVATDTANSIAEQTRSEIERSQAALAIVNALGYPKMADDFASQVEGELTAENAATFLQGKGLEPRSLEAQDESTKQSTPADPAEGLAATASLGNQLAAVASGAGASGVAQRTEDKLDQADSSVEVTRIMREAGLTN